MRLSDTLDGWEPQHFCFEHLSSQELQKYENFMHIIYEYMNTCHNIQISELQRRKKAVNLARKNNLNGDMVHIQLHEAQISIR